MSKWKIAAGTEIEMWLIGSFDGSESFVTPNDLVVTEWPGKCESDSVSFFRLNNWCIAVESQRVERLENSTDVQTTTKFSF